MAIDRAATLKNAEKMLRQGKLDQAIGEYDRVIADQPSDWTSRNTLGDLCVRAGQMERAVAEYRQIADAFRQDGFYSKAGALYRKILKYKPDDEEALLQAAEIAALQGLLRDARIGFTTVIERRRARGDDRGVQALIIRMGGLDPADVEARLAAIRAMVAVGEANAAQQSLRTLAEELRDKQDDRLVGVLDELSRMAPADPAIAMALAEAQLQRAPNDVGALSRLVELAVDAGLEDRVVDAQSRLCEAHLLAGSVHAARWIAEDLVGRHAGNQVHIERLRRVLRAAGETDIEGVVDAAAAMSDPLPLPPTPTPATTTPDAEAVVTAAPTPLAADLLAPPAVPEPPAVVAPGPAQPRSANVEVDLSILLDQIHKAPAAPGGAVSLDDVFTQMREEAQRRVAIDAAEQDYRRGLTLFQAGQLDDSIAALEAAARLPRFRFESASLLGRIFLNRGDLASAIEWLDRAAEAPAPSAGDLHKVLYNLAEALEAAGETARALAVSMQLQASAGRFLDVAARIKRLSNVQERG